MIPVSKFQPTTLISGTWGQNSKNQELSAKSSGLSAGKKELKGLCKERIFY
jgi:hypothetical protein